MKASEIREKWLKFFESKGHRIEPSASLVPHNDPTLLWINAGMAPLKPYFDGRVKELIRRGGEMIAPTEIEQQLLKHPAVRDCAVVGVPDEIMGEEVKAYVVASEEVSAVTLRAFLETRIARFMLPRYFSFVDSIPKTETQKIKRFALADLTAETVDTQPAH